MQYRRNLSGSDIPAQHFLEGKRNQHILPGFRFLRFPAQMREEQHIFRQPARHSIFQHIIRFTSHSDCLRVPLTTFFPGYGRPGTTLIPQVTLRIPMYCNYTFLISPIVTDLRPGREAPGI